MPDKRADWHANLYICAYILAETLSSRMCFSVTQYVILGVCCTVHNWPPSRPTLCLAGVECY